MAPKSDLGQEGIRISKHSFIFFIPQTLILSTHHIPGTILGAGHITVNVADKGALMECAFS